MSASDLKNEGRSVVRASLETPNFSFHVYADSPEQGTDLLGAAWERHADQTGAAWTWDEIKDDVQYEDVTIGVVYRDGSEI